MDLKIGGVYRHYKGNRYKIIAFARHSETLEELVIYEALYDNGGIWARPREMFCDCVTVGSESVRRFAPEPEESAI